MFLYSHVLISVVISVIISHAMHDHKSKDHWPLCSELDPQYEKPAPICVNWKQLLKDSAPDIYFTTQYFSPFNVKRLICAAPKDCGFGNEGILIKRLAPVRITVNKPNPSLMFSRWKARAQHPPHPHLVLHRILHSPGYRFKPNFGKHWIWTWGRKEHRLGFRSRISGSHMHLQPELPDVIEEAVEFSRI